MIKGVVHIGLSAKDLKQLQEFYCDHLGFELVMERSWDVGTEMSNLVEQATGLKNPAAKAAMVKKGDMVVELFEYSSPKPKPQPPGWKVSDLGYTHICLEVEDLDAEYERLAKAGMTFHGPPPKELFMGVMRGIYGQDPEGNVIELLERVGAA